MDFEHCATSNVDVKRCAVRAHPYGSPCRRGIEIGLILSQNRCRCSRKRRMIDRGRPDVAAIAGSVLDIETSLEFGLSCCRFQLDNL